MASFSGISRFKDLADKNTGEVATADIAESAITSEKISDVIFQTDFIGQTLPDELTSVIVGGGSASFSSAACVHHYILTSGTLQGELGRVRTASTYGQFSTAHNLSFSTRFQQSNFTSLALFGFESATANNFIYGGCHPNASATNYMLQTDNGTGTPNNIVTAVALDTAMHKHKLVVTSTTIKYYIDDVERASTNVLIPLTSTGLYANLIAYFLAGVALTQTIDYIKIWGGR